MCTTNAPVLSFLALKLLLPLDRTGHPRRPHNQPHLLAKSHNHQPLFPLLLLHRDTASPRKFPPWPLTLLILAQALPPQLLSQDVPHLPKLSQPTPSADGVNEFPQTGPSQSIPGSPPPGFPVHIAQAAPRPYLSRSQQPLTTCQPPHPVPHASNSPARCRHSQPLGTLRLCARRGPRVALACTTPPCPGLSAAGLGEFRPPPSLLRRTSRAPPRATRSPRPRAPHATAQRRTAGQRRASSLARPGPS